MLLVNHVNRVARLYDQGPQDNPFELTVASAGLHGVQFIVVDRDAGSEQVITVDRSELEAALAITRIESECEDCR